MAAANLHMSIFFTYFALSEMLEKICIFAVLFILYEIYWPEKLHMTYAFYLVSPHSFFWAVSVSVPNCFSF